MYVTGMVDVRSGRLLDVVEGRTTAAVREWLDNRDPAWIAQIREVTIDPYAGYKTAVAGHDGRLRHARLIADHFHLIRCPSTSWRNWSARPIWLGSPIPPIGC